MKGKKFIVIMAILIIMCSFQAVTAFEDNNLTQAEMPIEEADSVDTLEVSLQDSSHNLSADVNKISNDDFILQESEDSKNDDAPVLLESDSEDLQASSDEPVLGAITPGTFIYGVDYDQNRANDDIIPLDRFFKAVYWGIRNYMENNPSATHEWNVFLNNKTFSGGYGDAGVGTISTGYLSPDNGRVNYLTFNGMNFNSNMPLTIHLYGGSSIDDTRTSTLDLADYGASYALLDFSTPNSSITGIKFKNFNVNDHPNTVDPDTTVPFIKLGDKSKPNNNIDDLIHNCTFENIVLNPNQPIYEVGDGVTKDLYFYYDTSSLENLIKFIFWKVRDNAKDGIVDFNVFLGNNTFTGAYGTDGVAKISTGYYSWDNDGSAGRASYITFRNLDPKDNKFSYNRNITVHLYGGKNKDDTSTSTIDLSKYAADYRFIDLSGGSSTITGINFKNFNANNYKATKSESTSMPFIFLGDEKIQNYQSKLINCSFENITLNHRQSLVRMAFQDSPQGEAIVKSGGLVENCTFKYNSASQMIAISGSPSDSKHSDEGPLFYGFKANGNTFIGNVGTQEFNSTSKSLGFCFKIWNEAVNVTLDRNTFINNTNAVHGAAYCIIGFNVTITNNYIEGNQAIYGAGIEAHNGNITIINSTFINNVASGNHSQYAYRDGSGAAIALLGSNNYIINCTFTNNTAHGHAGAIDIVGGFKTLSDGTIYYLVANNTVIKDSKFYDNIALDYAGGVHINGTNTRIDNSTFEGNNASNAGAVKLIGENVTIVNSTFYNNNAIQGGAGYIEGANAKVLESVFIDNDATHNVDKVRPNATMIAAGGALYIIGSYANVTNNTFIRNSANRIGSKGIVEGFGGALYIDGKNITFTIDNFVNNTAIRGGAAYINGNGIHADRLNYTGNMAIEGGALYIVGDGVSISNSNFTDNNATKNMDDINTTGLSIDVAGGAIDIVGYNTVISNNEFVKNYAINGNGGAISIDGHNANITVNNFEHNEAVHGGAVYIESISTHSNIDDANFTYNNAAVGGAIFIRGSNTKIGNANFTNNNATRFLSFDLDSKYDNLNAVGGAIGILGNNSLIYNATFNKNTAIGKVKESYGGAIAIQGFNTTLEGTGFTNNQAVIGGALYFSGTLNDVNETDFINNSAVQGGAIYIANSDATFGHSKFHNNSATYSLRFELESDKLKNLITIGGAIYIPGNSIYVQESEFINNTAYGRFTNGGLGGAIAVNGSHDFIINSTFKNNQAIKGGAFYLEGDDTNIIGSNFTENRAIIGGVGYIDGVYSLVDNSNFKDNYATHDGLRFDVNSDLKNVPTVAGAINIIGENINISSSNFENNRAIATNKDDSIGAGSIYVEGNNATIINSAFNTNNAIKGGAIFIVVNHTDIINCNFTRNSVTNFTNMEGIGGAVYLENATDSEFKGCIFKENTASINGGAIDWHQGCVEGLIDECLFEDNSAASNGGAIFWFGEGGKIKDSNFTSNKANGTSVCRMGNSGDGGAIMWTGSNGSIDGCLFTENNAKQNGGAVYFRGVEGMADCANNIIENSKFENNTAGIDGGAVNWHDGANKGSIKTSSFTNNSAENKGGAVYWKGHEGSIEDSNFTKNTALKGGAVYWTGIDANIKNSRFVLNNASEGGAVFLENCTHGDKIHMVISDSYFEKNSAKNDGGAINWNDGKDMTVQTTQFVNNTAKRGGAIFINALGDYLITESDFTYNEAILGGAAYLNVENNATIDYSTFDYNKAVQGGAIYIAANKNRIANSNFNYNNATYSIRVDRGNDERKTKGGAIYIAGEDNVVKDSKFYNNIAVATNESTEIIQTIPGLLGAYLKTTGVDDDGLGGAIYIEGNNNQIISDEFDYNVARNGSAIYNDASGTSFKNGLFIKNQAWSYVLEVNATPNKVYHGENIPINVYNYVAGDNILNAIYNAKGVNDVTFDNVGFIIDDDVTKIRRTTHAHPVLGAEEGMLYQDSLERYQPMVIEFVNKAGKTILTKTVLTDLYGNHSFSITGADSLKLTPGNYTIKAYHPEDRNYKYIIAANKLEIIPEVKLDVKKVADDNDYGLGDIVTFTITVTNNGPSNATNVTINDTLPQGLTLVEGDLKHKIDLLEVGKSYNFTVKARAVDEGHWTNVASANCHENSTIVKANVTVPVFNPDLKIVKTTNESIAMLGDLVNFTISVLNHGVKNATNVVITDILNTDAFELVDSNQTYTRDGNKLIWKLDKLNSDQTHKIWIVVRTLKTGSYNNTATVNCSEEPTVKRSNVTVKVYHPDLNVTKVALEEIAYNGKTAQFKIIIHNIGDMELTGIFVDEIIPEGLTYDSFIGSNWTKQGNKFLYNGSLAIDEDLELIVVVIPTRSGNFTNKIVVGADNVTVHNASASIRVYTPSLEVREISNNPKVIAGDPVSFTVVVTNDGDCVLGDVYVDNQFPDGLTYTGFDGANWTKEGNRFKYSGNLKPGESVNYTLYFNTIHGGQFVPNVVAGSNLTSNDTAKAYSENVTQVLTPEMSVAKVSDKSVVKVGDRVIFTITVKNTGECMLGGIFVVDEIPEGLEFVNFTGSGWTRDGNRYDYNGSLDSNESVTLTIICRAIEAGYVTNVVIAGSNLTGNVSDNVVVQVIDEEEVDPTPDPTPAPTPIPDSEPADGDDKPVKVSVDDKATGNPVLMLILVILMVIPLRRRKQ